MRLHSDNVESVHTNVRDAHIDNAKGLLIALVVFGHVLENMGGWSFPLLRGLLTLIYLFHMPALAFLAGMTAKPRGYGRRIVSIAVMLLLFQSAYLLFSAARGKIFEDPFEPYWLLWFLLSMIWWLALLHLVSHHKGALWLAFVIALIAGGVQWIGYPLSLSRTIVLFPFFLAGHKYGAKLCDLMARRPRIRWFSFLPFFMAASVTYLMEPDPRWLYGSSSYETLSAGLYEGITARTFLLLAAASAIIFIMGSVSTSDTFASKTGPMSLTIYLLHGFPVKALAPLLSDITPRFGEGFALITATALSIALLFVLAQPTWDRWIRKSAALVTDRLMQEAAKRLRH